MQWIAKLLFPWLLRGAMKIGAKAFGRIDTRRNAILSRKWMWNHAWFPLRAKISDSTTKLDDPLAEFLYVNQACCLDDGTAKELTVTIKQFVTDGDKAGALMELNRLEVMLGIDKVYD